MTLYSIERRLNRYSAALSSGVTGCLLRTARCGVVTPNRFAAPASPLATATAASITRGPLSAPLDPRICMAKLEQLCARQPVVSTSFLAFESESDEWPLSL
jgi:hypothetical protein